MRILAMSTAASVLALGACQRNEPAQPVEDAAAAADAATDASEQALDDSGVVNESGKSASVDLTGGARAARAASTNVEGGPTAGRADVERTEDARIAGYVATAQGPRRANGQSASAGDARDSAQAAAERTNLRPRPDVPGAR